MSAPAAIAHAKVHAHSHDHDHADEDHAHHHHDHAHTHPHGCGCGAHHDTSKAGLQRRLLFVFAAVVCLLVGAVLPFFRPEQVELAALWSLLGALLASAPIAWDTIAGLQAKSSENTDFYMNQFMILAVAACVASGQYLTGGVVAIVLLVGHILEDRSMLGASEAISNLLNLSRHRARRLVEGHEEEIDSERLAPGDRIRLRPGDMIPTDGVVRQGHSTVNQANITGESLPVEVRDGSEVFAGTVNMTGSLEVDVTRAGRDTVLGRVQQIVEEAQSTRAPIVRLTEEYARYYMPLVLLLAGAVLFFTHDFQRAISIIIVSIPCAFVMAGPTAMVAALAAAARLGILVKSTRFFEAASDLDTMVFDKTGTLTTGNLHVAKIMATESFDPNQLLSLAAALECHSTHPAARAIVQTAADAGLALPPADHFREEHGLGVAGTVNGNSIQVGRRSWLNEENVTGLPTEDALPHCAAISIAVAGSYAGTIYLSDTLRPETSGLKEILAEEGIDHCVMLTGDRHSIAQEMATRLGFTDFQADCFPAQKRDAVEALKGVGRRVAVVGDGVNDAPALAAGHVGIAMGSLGSDVAIQTADIALMSSDLRRVGDFLRLAQQTIAIVNQNMFCGLAFLALTLVLSSAGFIPPIAAAFLHELAAFFVIFNSARLLKFEGTGTTKTLE